MIFTILGKVRMCEIKLFPLIKKNAYVCVFLFLINSVFVFIFI